MSADEPNISAGLQSFLDQRKIKFDQNNKPKTNTAREKDLAVVRAVSSFY